MHNCVRRNLDIFSKGLKEFLLKKTTMSVKPLLLHHLSPRQNSTYEPREEPSVVTAAPKKNLCCVIRQQRRGRKLDTAMKQPRSLSCEAR